MGFIIDWKNGEGHPYWNRITDRFEQIEFLDFSKFPLADHEFADLEHLNYKGAKVFSIWFQHMLAQGLLTRADKQAHIDREFRQIEKTSNQAGAIINH